MNSKLKFLILFFSGGLLIVLFQNFDSFSETKSYEEKEIQLYVMEMEQEINESNTEAISPGCLPYGMVALCPPAGVGCRWQVVSTSVFRITRPILNFYACSSMISSYLSTTQVLAPYYVNGIANAHKRVTVPTCTPMSTVGSVTPNIPFEFRESYQNMAWLCPGSPGNWKPVNDEY